MLTVAILGFGNRGSLYADIIKDCGKARVVAVCDINQARLDSAARDFQVPKDGLFICPEDFMAKKRADMLIVATLDDDHYDKAVRAMHMGYDILLEKPITTDLEQCIQLDALAKKLNRKVAVCHVLRYTAFYRGIKDVIDSGKIGDVVTITQTENVAYWHQSHSFVRGNWRRLDETAPMILAKCCHDFDILYWLAGRKCKTVSSFGSLYFFKEAHAPANSGAHCFDCGVRDECPYNCIKFYTNNPGWFNGVRTKSAPVTAQTYAEEVAAVLSDTNNPYSRCVFRCDNDVVDHQVVNMLFEGGATAQLTMTAFSDLCTRIIKVHGTYGEIVGDFEQKSFTVTVYGKGSETIDLTKITNDFSGHGGGDRIMTIDFINALTGEESSKGLTMLEQSVLSHRMAFAAEQSRIQNGKPINIK